MDGEVIASTEPAKERAADDTTRTKEDHCRSARTKPARKLVAFPECWNKSCRPWNRRVCDCRSKCRNYPCRYNWNACGCPKKYRCKCIRRVHSAKGSCEVSAKVHPDESNDNTPSAPDDGTKGAPQDQGQDNDEARTVEEILGFVIDLGHANQQQLFLLRNGKMPCADKYLLRDEYNSIDVELDKIWDEAFYGQNLDAETLREKLRVQKHRIDYIKCKHDKLIQRYKHHRNSLLFYICKFLSWCIL